MPHRVSTQARRRTPLGAEILDFLRVAPPRVAFSLLEILEGLGDATPPALELGSDPSSSATRLVDELRFVQHTGEAAARVRARYLHALHTLELLGEVEAFESEKGTLWACPRRSRTQFELEDHR